MISKSEKIICVESAGYSLIAQFMQNENSAVREILVQGVIDAVEKRIQEIEEE